MVVVVVLWANVLGFPILLGGGCRRSHVRPQIGARKFSEPTCDYKLMYYHVYRLDPRGDFKVKSYNCMFVF
jgi:hypothetical protein